MKHYYVLLVGIFVLTINQSFSQGCVAIRQFSSCAGNILSQNLLSKGQSQFSMNYRYYKSYKHFSGTHENADRVANNTEVINHSNSWDFNFTYGLSNRLFASATLPFVIYTRSSLYEHGRTERNTTYARGIADARLGVGYWLFNPTADSKGNLALGLGLKLPTGDFHATDIFYNVGPTGEQQVRPVDQSIQPGDGGFGATVDFQFYRILTGNLSVFGGGFYLLNPRNTNGVPTFRETLNPILANESIMSVPDQYALRGGISYSFMPTIGFSLGARYEGVPVRDLVGKDEGFRRPGNVTSIEPSVTYMKDRFSANLSVPYAVRRARPQSVTDMETEKATGSFRRGDAAFADYLINFGVSYRFLEKSKSLVTNY